MSTQRVARRYLRSTMLSGFAAASMLPAFATSALAQDEEVSEDRIIVTGSRIARDANIDAPTAVTSVTAELITFSGETNLSSILRQVPSFGVSGLTAGNTNFSLQSGGINTLELRNLDEDRTLILQNGRRIVGGLPGTSIVDINLIPVDLIETVDVVTGGASSIYGSDALAGVVNIMLKDDFEGVQFTSQYGETFDFGDNREYSFRLTLGGNFGDGRGNAVLSAEYVNNGGIASSNRPETQIDDFAACRFSLDPNDCQFSVEPFTSSFPPQGRFIVENDEGTPGDATDDTSASFNPDGSPFAFGTLTDGFNRQAFRTIIVPIERYTLNAIADYDIYEGDNFSVTAFIEGAYGSTFTRTAFEPVPLSSDDVFDEGQSTGVPLMIGQTGSGIMITNPLIPQPLVDLALAGNDDNIGFVRRTVEIGARGNEALRETFRVVTGLKGTAFQDYNWDLFVNYGRTSRSQETTASINALNFRNALDIELNNETGLLQCADPIARGQGCVPINVFGEGAISPEAADYVRHIGIINARIEQTQIGGTFSGPVPGIELPAGSIDFAAGFEWRREFSDNQPDGLQQAGLTTGNAIAGNRGQYEVYELFGEVNVPIVEDQPFFERLDIGGAYRFSDYSTVGTTHAYSANASWAPVENVRVRFQYARAVRAPNIAELFNGGTENFATISDPCDGLATETDQTIVNTCLQDPLVAARFNATGDFALTQVEAQGTGGFSGVGNRNLDPETSDSFNVGLVFTNDFGAAGDFSFSVDYFNIDIRDAIAQPGRQFTVNQCYQSGDLAGNEFCGFIIRDDQGVVSTIGEITDVNTAQVNAGFIKTAGIDFAITHSLDLGNWDSLNGVMSSVPGFDDAGSLSFRANYTWLRKYESEIFGAFEDDLGDTGVFEHEVLAGWIYSNGPFTFTWDSQWLSNSTVDDDFALFNFEVGDYWRHDMQTRYSFNDGLAEIFFGINNITDAEAPRILSGVTGSFAANATGTDTDPAIFDVIGRQFTAGLRLRF